MTRVEIGTFPVVNGEIFTVGDDFAAAMLQQATREADRAKAEAERVRLAAAAEQARAQNTRRARTMRRVKRALKCLSR
jgi:hypothetical protein